MVATGDSMIGSADAGRARLWTVVVAATALPSLIILCSTLWHVPYQLEESVAIFADVASRPVSEFFIPTSSYYRPLYFVALSAAWHSAPSLGDALNAIRLLHIVPVTMLVLLLIRHLRPTTPVDAAAATVAVAVLVGSPGFVDNLELPLSYTIVGMLAALLVWILLEREHRPWHGPAVITMTLIAIGFKEQGLVLAPVVMVAWWTGAPGVGRITVATVASIAVAYVGFRLVTHDPTLPLFEQDVGLGFSVLSTDEAAARFGMFPLSIYAYNAASTVLNILFSEPTEGVFRITRAVTEGQLRPWHLVYLFSSLFLTGLIGWWGFGALRLVEERQWSPEARLFLVTVVAVAACGALSFNYSRDRLGGMAVVFYALTSFFAVRATAARAIRASHLKTAITATALVLLASGWQLRAMYTIEYTRQRAENSQRDLVTVTAERRAEFASRPEYLRIVQVMIEQGTAPNAVQYTRYPRWIVQLLGEY